ncbi:MAG: hypothetical protein DDT40_01447 [candidate division WS2 bacterium]|nr:hypothetical protein [Candidatus Psychracetigena formicireducens]
MAVNLKKSELLKTHGVEGTTLYGGRIGEPLVTSEILSDDYLADWTYSTVTKMRRSDGMVAALLRAVSLMIRGADWEVRAASDEPGDLEIAAFVEENLWRVWDGFISQALLYLPYGFMLFEVLWEARDWKPEGKAARQALQWKRLAPRMPWTVDQWGMEEGTLAKVVQLAQAGDTGREQFRGNQHIEAGLQALAYQRRALQNQRDQARAVGRGDPGRLAARRGVARDGEGVHQGTPGTAGERGGAPVPRPRGGHRQGVHDHGPWRRAGRDFRPARPYPAPRRAPGAVRPSRVPLLRGDHLREPGGGGLADGAVPDVPPVGRGLRGRGCQQGPSWRGGGDPPACELEFRPRRARARARMHPRGPAG